MRTDRPSQQRRQTIHEDDRLVLVLLRDNRTFVGVLKAFDHFGNLLIDRTIERLIHPTLPGEFSVVYLGCLIVRGENIVLFGSLEPNALVQHFQRLTQHEPIIDHSPSLFTREVPLFEILKAQKEWEEKYLHAQAIWTEFRKRRQAATWLDQNSDLERQFVFELLKKTSGGDRYTTQEVETARMLFFKYITAVADALSTLESHKATLALEAD